MYVRPSDDEISWLGNDNFFVNAELDLSSDDVEDLVVFFMEMPRRTVPLLQVAIKN
ncbi:MAG: hypothetical protein BWX79_00117 [Alphaproteobacteria bacterium ADurb.Bin100]|nr:MAG: hypothetical protein BWX79_00117 [Alphaproteobacteria bacterium ADurb.Bin100]